MLRLGVATGFLWTLGQLLACGSSSPATTPGEHDAGKSLARDAGTRVKQRFVAIELPPVASQSFGPGADGAFDFGTIEPIDGAETCVAMRRDAFKTFQQFSPLQEQNCVTTAAGEVVRLERVPANSDLVVTVSKEGFLPATLSSRVEDADLPIPSWAGALVTLLLRPDQAAPWLDAADSVPDASTVVLIVSMVWGGPPAAVSSGAPFIGWNATASGVTPAEEASIEIQRDAEPPDPPLELSPLRSDRPSFVALPEGLYHLRVSHPRAICTPLDVNSETENNGLSGNIPGEIELPVVSGHSAIMVSQCWCYPMNADERLHDLASCSFEPADAAP